MPIEQFEAIALNICVGGLIAFMFFIIYDLGKRSNAGTLGRIMLFIGLGVGMLGFIIKTILVEFLEL